MRRVLRPGGRIAFATIEVPVGLSPRERRRAVDAGPPAPAVRRPYPEMLAAAGFVEIGERDVTADYLATVRAWSEMTHRRLDEVVVYETRDVVDERLIGWRAATEVVEAGSLRRTLYWAQRP